MIVVQLVHLNVVILDQQYVLFNVLQTVFVKIDINWMMMKIVFLKMNVKISTIIIILCPLNVKSGFDGCNYCFCDGLGNINSCTEIACISGTIAPSGCKTCEIGYALNTVTNECESGMFLYLYKKTIHNKIDIFSNLFSKENLYK